MKAKAIARQGFCDVYQETNATALKDSHPRWFVQPSANCRNFGVALAIAYLPFQLLTIGALIAI
jgi:hypothetical protein